VETTGAGRFDQNVGDTLSYLAHSEGRDLQGDLPDPNGDGGLHGSIPIQVLGMVRKKANFKEGWSSSHGCAEMDHPTAWPMQDKCGR
jgi:hypothetical protein